MRIKRKRARVHHTNVVNANNAGGGIEQAASGVHCTVQSVSAPTRTAKPLASGQGGEQGGWYTGSGKVRSVERGG